MAISMFVSPYEVFKNTNMLTTVINDDVKQYHFVEQFRYSSSMLKK